MMLPILLLITASQLAAAPPPTPSAAASSAAVPPVEVVVYSDFQCPFCAVFSKSFRDVQTAGVDGVAATFTFKHFPLSMHPKAQLEHQAALAADAQGKFWEMHDLLFSNQRRADRDDLIAYARELRLDVPRFIRDMDSDAVKRTIAEQVLDGDRRGITGTPTFFVNGSAYVGAKSAEQLHQIVQGEQRRVVALSEISEAMMSRGPAKAPVTIEFFADLQSPITRSAVVVLEDVMRKYPSDLRLQFRNFPLAFHPQAGLAHEAAVTAARDGRFWEFLTYVLNHQDALREQELVALAGRIGLDAERFAATLRDHRYAPRVEADVIAGTRRGIRGSPVIFVNGKRIDGVPSLQTLIEYVEAARAGQTVNSFQR